jgi:hypothetical protein
VMLIVARSGEIYARLQFAAGPRANVCLSVRVDWSQWAQVMADHAAQLEDLLEGWMDEYGRNIRPEVVPAKRQKIGPPADGTGIADDRDRIVDPEVEWWDFDEQRARQAELEAEYWSRGVFS